MSLEGYPDEHIRRIRLVAERVRRHYTCGRSYLKCHGAANDVVDALERDPHITRLGIKAEFAGGDWDGGAHCWAHLEHPAWPGPIIVDVTQDQFQKWIPWMQDGEWTGGFRREPGTKRLPAIFIGPYEGHEYFRVVIGEEIHCG